jgi:hypothetical protein
VTNRLSYGTAVAQPFLHPFRCRTAHEPRYLSWNSD